MIIIPSKPEGAALLIASKLKCKFDLNVEYQNELKVKAKES